MTNMVNTTNRATSPPSGGDRIAGLFLVCAALAFFAGWTLAPRIAAGQDPSNEPEILIESDDEPIEVSISTRSRIEIQGIDNRPSWVGTTPVRAGDVHRTAVQTGPYHLQRDAHRALDDMLLQSVNNYIDEWLDVDDAHVLVSFDLDFIKTRLLQPISESSDEYQYDEVALHPLPVGPMHESHALLEFDREFRDEIDGRWKRIVETKRLLQTGLGGFGVLGLLGVLFGYFRLDTATRGFYTGRLQFLAAVAILALVAAGVLMAQWVPGM